MTFLPLESDLIVDAAFSQDEIGLIARTIAPFQEEDLWQDYVQRELRSRTMATLPRLVSLCDAIEDRLRQGQHSCILQGSGFLTVAEAERVKYIAAISILLGDLSQSNVTDHKSGVVVEAVRPLHKEGRDVTYTLGACEPHADESSKFTPEDIACLWCVRQARWGGATTVWSARKLTSTIAAMPKGDVLLESLRTRQFPFGGKLRQPPRILMAPILFGEDGIRFRRGTIDDAFNVLNQEPDPEQSLALDALTKAIISTVPLGWRLNPGEALVVLNRRVLHAREDFDDLSRWLIRTRLYNSRLSNSHLEQNVSWYNDEFSQ